VPDLPSYLGLEKNAEQKNLEVGLSILVGQIKCRILTTTANMSIETSDLMSAALRIVRTPVGFLGLSTTGNIMSNRCIDENGFARRVAGNA
jgi:hypothetical protein